MGMERRQFLRVACRGAIAEIFVQGASVGMHSVEDVSDGGLFLASPSPVLPVNTHVEVHIVDSKPRVQCQAQVVAVVGPGEARPSGYALKLEAGTEDVVAAVASASAARPVKPPAPRRPTSEHSLPSEMPRVLIVLHSAGLRRALCDALGAFRVTAVAFAPGELERGLVKSLRVALFEMVSVDEGIDRMAALHAKAPKARALLFSRKLPDPVGRKRLQEAGADQLVLPPLEPFDVLKRLFTKARGDLSKLNDA